MFSLHRHAEQLRASPGGAPAGEEELLPCFLCGDRATGRRALADERHAFEDAAYQTVGRDCCLPRRQPQVLIDPKRQLQKLAAQRDLPSRSASQQLFGHWRIPNSATPQRELRHDVLLAPLLLAASSSLARPTRHRGAHAVLRIDSQTQMGGMSVLPYGHNASVPMMAATLSQLHHRAPPASS